MAGGTFRLKGHGTQEYKPTVVAIFPPFERVVFVSFRIERFPEGRLCNFKCLCAIHLGVIWLANQGRASYPIHPVRNDPGSMAAFKATMWDTNTPDEQDRCRTMGKPRQTLASRSAFSPNLRCRYQPECGPTVVNESATRPCNTTEVMTGGFLRYRRLHRENPMSDHRCRPTAAPAKKDSCTTRLQPSASRH